MARNYRIGRRDPAADRTAARQSSLRSMNLATVLQLVAAASHPVSRADVAGLSGLTRSTVSRLVDELVEHDLVSELDPVFAGLRGRPAVPLQAAGGSWVGLGLEINVRHMAACLVDLSGRVLGRRHVEGDLSGSDPDAVIDAVGRLGADLLGTLGGESTLVGARLALPGLVDAADGVLLRAPNLGWWDVRPTERLRAALGCGPAWLGIGNEADFAAVTVALDAPGRPSERPDFLYVSGSVGIGSALVTNGTVKTGRHGWAGELGHVCVDPRGPRCACGADGCLEAFVGQQALLDAAGVTGADELVAALAAGDPRALDAVAAGARALGIALAGALNLLDVSRVVLGGQLAALAEHLLPEVRRQVAARVIAAPFAEPEVEVVAPELEMAALGAAYESLAVLLADPASWLLDGQDATDVVAG